MRDGKKRSVKKGREGKGDKARVRKVRRQDKNKGRELNFEQERKETREKYRRRETC